MLYIKLFIEREKNTGQSAADVLDYYWYGHLRKIILYNRLEINWLPVAKTKIHL